ncbi:hypothetical protein D6C95_08688 [Aureobasidium pullulans]|nr:hypothetical protein D6C95_08688 [Aureobasidium pullulans]
MCVVGVLWPDKGFELSSFALFRVISWAQVHMFESIGSHLINSYAGYGGFNFSTSGVTISSAARASPATWEHITNQYHQVLVYPTIASERHGLELQKELLSMEGATFAAKAHIKTQQLATSLKVALDQVDGSDGSVLDRTTLEGIAQSLVLLLDTPDAMTKKCYDELVGSKRRLGSMAKAATEIAWSLRMRISLIF